MLVVLIGALLVGVEITLLSVILLVAWVFGVAYFVGVFC